MQTIPAPYGYEPEAPIPVGGGILLGPFAERSYLQRLRSLGGAELDFERVGTAEGVDGIIDIYEVTAKGSDATSHLCFNIYSNEPFGIPEGYAFAPVDYKWALPKIIVREIPGDDALVTTPAQSEGWLVKDGPGNTFGVVKYSDEGLDVDLTESLAPLIEDKLEQLIAICPREHISGLLSDYFKSVLPIESGGLLHGVQMTIEPKPIVSELWGAESVKGTRHFRLIFWLALTAVVVLGSIYFALQ